jgi:hypothetical protein
MACNRYAGKATTAILSFYPSLPYPFLLQSLYSSIPARFPFRPQMRTTELGILLRQIDFFLRARALPFSLA